MVSIDAGIATHIIPAVVAGLECKSQGIADGNMTMFAAAEEVAATAAATIRGRTHLKRAWVQEAQRVNDIFHMNQFISHLPHFTPKHSNVSMPVKFSCMFLPLLTSLMVAVVIF